MKMLVALAGAIAIAATASVTAQDHITPARFAGGSVPTIAAQPAPVVGAGQVFVEVDVSAEGRVTAVAPLRVTPPYADAVLQAVRGWRFVPAEELKADPARPGTPPVRVPVRSKVLVAALFAAPTLLVPTLGEPPRDMVAPSPTLAFPLTVAGPARTPFSYNSGVVLMEARLDATGRITNLVVLQSAPPFDSAALEAVRGWTFRPARDKGVAAPTWVYVMMGFPIPVT